jgi:hypothetical protein
MPVDSLKVGWQGSEFWLCVAVVALGAVAVALGHPWPGMVGASVSALGYGLSRGLSKAAFSSRGGSSTRVI